MNAGAKPTRAGGHDGEVVVIGGGLAGVSAAIRLADAGRQVVLLESRPRLGGATYSFTRGELTVDTGQHVLLRCYSAYRELLARLGVSDRVTMAERLDIPVLLAGGGQARLRSARGLPAPLHLLPALGRYGALTRAERLRAVGAAAAFRRVDPDDPATDEIPFGRWLAEHGQDEPAVRRLWGLLCVAALNQRPEQASLALMARVVRTGLLTGARSADIGVPAVPLAALHDEPARTVLARLGVRVLLSERVERLDPVPDGIVVRTRAGETEAAQVVLAAPHRVAARLVPVEAAPDRQRWAGLGSSPIVNAHVHYDRLVTGSRLAGQRFAAAPDSGVQWVFDRTAAAGASRGQYLVTSVSAADDALELPAAELIAAQTAELARLFPAAASAAVLDAFVTREPHATFCQQAGSAALRPPARTALAGVALAGAWTATGWPDTMEGAVRSGLTAADTLLGGPNGRTEPVGSVRTEVSA